MSQQQEIAGARTAGDRAESGMTLIEMAVAASVLTLIAFGVLSTITVSFSADRSAQRLTDTQRFAQEVMETVKATPFNQLLALDGSTTTSGDERAVIHVDVVATGLLRVEVEANDAGDSTVTTRLVTTMASLN